MSFQLHLDTEPVSQTDPEEPLCVTPETTIAETFDLLSRHPQGCVLVCRDDSLVGIFTERDALRLMSEGADLERPIQAVMVDQVVHLSATDTVKKAITEMADGGYRQLPVVDDDLCPVGVVKVSGILHYLVEHFPNVVYTLPPEPNHKTRQREGA